MVFALSLCGRTARGISLFMGLARLYNTPQDYLQVELKTRLERRPHYSMRAFARDIGISPSSLVEFLSEKTGFSTARAHDVALRLKLNPDEKEHFIDLVEAKYSRFVEKRKKAKQRIQLRKKSGTGRLGVDEFLVISDWYHLAMVELIDMDSAYCSPSRLAKALGLDLETATQGLKRLKKLNLVTKSGDSGQWVASDDWTVLGGESPSEAVRNFHQQILELSQSALEHQGMEKRTSLSGLMSIDKSKRKTFQNELQKVFTQIAAKYCDAEKKDLLVGLTIQGFEVFEKQGGAK